MTSTHDARAGVFARSMRFRACLTLAVASLIFTSFVDVRAASAGDLDGVASFDIPAQSLDKALLEFGLQAHVQIMFAPDSKTALARTKEVIGRYTGRAVLAALLRGTGLSYSLHRNTIAVVPLKSSSGVSAEQAKNVDPPTEGGAQPSGDPPQNSAGDGKATKKQNAQLQEITITGTHIHSATGSVLPTQTFTQGDIDRSGLGTVAGFLETLPENFSGGMSENTDEDFAGGPQAGADATLGTGVNLRGLGNDATLVLLDGHRLAPADLVGNFIDLSLIPEDAVGRIDVVTDGASAIYGSDAVGGVVNITTRQNFNGAETRVRFGSDDHNNVHESEIGQTFGRTWNSGSALVSYELYDKTPLSAADRDFTQSVPLPFTLLPEQVRQSALATLKQSITQNLLLYSDVYFSHRSTNSYDSILSLAEQQHGTSVTDSYGAILGARYAITDTTELDVSGDYSVGSADVQEFESPQPVLPYFDQKAKSILSTEEAVLNGALWSLPAGQLLYAVGAQFREESYDLADDVAHMVFAPTRDVSSGFAEVRIPVFGPSRNSAGPNALELSLADREDSYSDVGSTNNETLGLLWAPAESLRVTGTYGTSFVAPLLNYTNPALSEVFAYNTSLVPGSTPPGSAPVNLLFEFGGNPNLKPQTATTWTLGTTWGSQGTGGVTARINYYNIRFDNRINDLESAGYNPGFALLQASYLGPQIVQFNPPEALVQQLESSPTFVNFGATNPNDIGALIDARELNVSKVHTDGMDFGIADRMERGRTTFEPGADATVILHLRTQFTSLTPPAEILNTIYNPTKAKVRGHLLISQSPFSIAAFVNFVNSYTNNTTIPDSRISSWTTFDLSATYSCDMCGAFLPGFSATLGVLNLLNRAPPYATNGSGFAVNYDGANASPLGRFISLDLAVRW